MRLAVEGTTDAVTVPASLIQFNASLIKEGTIVKALTRRKISCAVRFSEPPASPEARDALCHNVYMFFAANPSDALLPTAVHQLTREEQAWVVDRLNHFDNYVNDNDRAIVTMAKMFNTAASALAAYGYLNDNHRVHRLEAVVPNFADFPLQLNFTLPDVTTDSGWRVHRMIGV
ncbi:hypothetical protein Q1695_003273 [Nippostrongylus brasiliensis]|nr:hypothetical protein Q1695_003273 [Nippostrongylus brasiliensis]